MATEVTIAGQVFTNLDWVVVDVKSDEAEVAAKQFLLAVALLTKQEA